METYKTPHMQNVYNIEKNKKQIFGNKLKINATAIVVAMFSLVVGLLGIVYGNLKAQVSANSALIQQIINSNHNCQKTIIQNQNSIIQNQKNIQNNQSEIKTTQVKIENMQNNLTTKLFNVSQSINKFNVKFSDEYLHSIIFNEICMYHKKNQ